jgi:hypothetical protein
MDVASDNLAPLILLDIHKVAEKREMIPKGKPSV